MHLPYNFSYDDVIKVPCKTLREYPEEVIRSAIDTVIDYYYQNGFPYYDHSKAEREFESLLKFDTSRILIGGNILQQFMLGLNTANSFHPEMWHVRCNNAKTPYEVFSDRDLFRTALRKRVKYSDTKLVAYNVRKSLKAFGVQSVSNFRPTVAKWVYSTFAPRNGNVLDPCAGYGGRLLGALSTDKLLTYHGIDANRKTQENNGEMAEYMTRLGANTGVVLDAIPFEDSSVGCNYDLVFTSPPYFNIEKYADDSTQSWVRYKTYEMWVNGFLRPLIEKSYFALKQGGFFALNVGNPIIDDTKKIATALFGEPSVYHMRLSKMLGRGNKSSISHKEEPLFIWKK